MRKSVILLLSFLTCTTIMAQLPNVSSGSIKRYENFQSKYVTARNVDVWLPDGYSAKKKYAVLYMHDGQMLFDSAVTWNHQAWEADEMIGKLLKQGKIKDVIVVAVWNGGATRHKDYFPQKVFEKIGENMQTKIKAEQFKGEPSADNYLKFLVTEVKPFIDSTFSTRKDVSNTFIMGSSMGGLISAYALCEYPAVFGGAACLSIHSPLLAYELIDENTDKEVSARFRDYLQTYLPKANTRKIYFDYGNKTLDSLYMPYQKKIDMVMKQKGYNAKHWQTKYFPGESHSEQSWAKRLDVPLLFLLKK